MGTPAFILLAAGVLLAADAPLKNTKVEKKLWAAISVNYPVWEKEVAGDPFMVYFALVNDGDKPIHPDAESSKLLVNGKEFKEWPFTIANGIRDHRWQTLPPGDYLSFAYALGRHFEEPGVYRLSWKGKDFEAREIVFRVVSKAGQLDPKIGPAEPEKYKSVLDAKDWANPYLVIRKDGIEVISKAVTPARKIIPAEEIRKTLRALPVEAWPYGRVVAVQEIGIRSDGDDQLIKGNKAKAEQALKSLRVKINWWPSK